MPGQRHRLAFAAVLLAGAYPATAAETKVSVRGSAGLGGDTNPYLSTVDTVRSLLMQLSVEPTLTRATPTSAISLSGRAHRRQYSADLPSSTSGNVRASASVRQSERLQLQGSASYSRDRSGDVVDDTAGAVDPRSVRIGKSANISASLRLSELVTLAPSLAISRNAFENSSSLRGYSSYSTGFGYSRQLSSRATFGARTDLALQRYGGGGHSAVVTVHGTGQLQLDELTLASAGFGAERVSLSGLTPVDTSQFLLSGNANICRRGLNLNMCLNGAVRSDASGLGDLRRTMSAGASVNYRLNEETSIALGANYQRSKPLGDSLLGPVAFGSVRASIDRKLSKALTLGAFSNYRHRSGNGSASSVAIGTDLRMSMGQN